MERTTNQIMAAIARKRPQLRETSIRSYRQKLKKLTVVIGEERSKDVNFLLDIKLITDKLENLPSKAMRSNLITIATIAYDVFDPTPRRELDALIRVKKRFDEDYNRYRDNQMKNRKEQANWITWDQADEKVRRFETFYKKEKGAWNAFYLLLGTLYVNKNGVFPRRNVFATVYYHDGRKFFNDDKPNFYDNKNMTLTLTQYKTSNKYGKQVYQLNRRTRLVKAIRRYRYWNKTQFMLVSPLTMKPLSSPSMTKHLNHIFGKGVSSSMLRKIYVSEEVDDDPDMSMSERRTIARRMGHSIQANMEIYTKND